MITTQGTVTIPKILRDTFGYKPNTRIFFYELDGLLIISKENIENVEEKFLGDDINV